MGNICNCRKKNKKKIVLLLVGLDNAGKTSTARGLAGEPLSPTIPTVGFSVTHLSHPAATIKIFDLGGGPHIRAIWPRYFVHVHGVIFVVDSADAGRLPEARAALADLLAHPKIAEKPVLVLANKQDGDDALDELEIIERLDLEAAANAHRCPTLLERCSAARRDAGVRRGLAWLAAYAVRHFDALEARVQADAAAQLAAEDAARRAQLAKMARDKPEADEDAIESYSSYERKMGEEGGDSVSETSSGDSFPPIFYVREEVRLERPRSAVEMVRRQLESGAAGARKVAGNKTAPLQLFDAPKSATTLRDKGGFEVRRLKSAGCIDFMPNVPMSSDDYHAEIVDLMRIDHRQGDGYCNGGNFLTESSE